MIKPMLCEEITEEQLGQYLDGKFVAERKHNGIRAIIDTTDGVKIYGRNGTDYTQRLTEIRSDAEKLPKGLIIDGEIVAFKDDKQWLAGAQKRCSTSNLSKQHQLKREIPVRFEAFDIIYYNDIPTMAKTYLSRKETLLDILSVMGDYGKVNFYDNIKYVPFFTDINYIWEHCKMWGWEGIVLKNTESSYLEGLRTFDWIKVKVWETATFTVRGYLESDKRGLKSLALFEDYGYVGRCGQGLDDADIECLMKFMQPTDDIDTTLDTEPIILVNPFEVTIKYYGFADDGKLRNAILLGIGIFKGNDDNT